MFLLCHNYEGSMGFLLEEWLNIGLLPSLKRLIKSLGYIARSLGGTRGGSLASPLKASSLWFFYIRFAQIWAKPNIFACVVWTRCDGAS